MKTIQQASHDGIKLQPVIRVLLQVKYYNEAVCVESKMKYAAENRYAYCDGKNKKVVLVL